MPAGEGAGMRGQTFDFKQINLMNEAGQADGAPGPARISKPCRPTPARRVLGAARRGRQVACARGVADIAGGMT